MAFHGRLPPWGIKSPVAVGFSVLGLERIEFEVSDRTAVTGDRGGELTAKTHPTLTQPFTIQGFKAVVRGLQGSIQGSLFAVRCKVL